MPANITDVSTFTDPATRPAGSDVRNAASVQAPFQGLANRTRWLRDRLASFIPESGGNADEHAYPSERIRKFTINLHHALRFNSADWSYPSNESSNYLLLSGSPTKLITFPLNPYLRHGQRIVSLVAIAKPGSDPGVGNRMRVGLYRSAPLDFTGSTAPTTPTLVCGVECTGTARAAFTATPGGTVIVVRDNGPSANAASDWWIQVTSTNDVVNDELYGLQLSVGETVVRNS